MPCKHIRNGKWTGKWYGQVKKNGSPIRSSLVDTRDEAKEWEVKTKKGLKEIQKSSSRIPTVSLLELATKYLDYSQRYAPKVYSEKRGVFRRFFEVFKPSVPVDKLNNTYALNYLQKQYRGRSGYAANKDRKNLAAAWAFGIKFIEGFPAHNPWLVVEKFPETRHDRYMPTEEDFWRVVAVAKGQDRVILLAFYHLAARRGELYRLRWNDINFLNNRVRLGTRKRKGGSLEYDWVEMSDELREVFLEHRKSTQKEWVFTQSVGRHQGKPYTENRGFPQELCEKAGVKPFGCHAIRHLAASVLAAHGVPAIEIKAHLRHKKLATTEKYTRPFGLDRRNLTYLQSKKSDQRYNNGYNTKKKGPKVLPFSPLAMG